MMGTSGGSGPTEQTRTERELRVAGYGFALDDFQLRALDAIDAGQSVLVAAPTGSGKTVVAEYAVGRVLDRGLRAFYTAPVKALSNQKYHDLVKLRGADNVGLLTGDNAINSDAPVVVMTTEVLRNMIYARSPALAQLGLVVLDEVHYLQDTYRGPVWEEVIIHLPRSVKLVCLSATVSNADELTDWISTVRGPTTSVIETKRPVTLHHLTMIGDKTQDRLHLLPTLINGNPNAEATRIDNEAARGWKGGAKLSGKRKLYTPRRLEVIERLDREDMLPAIYFIFSRNACDDAAKACLDAGVRLTTGPERDRIREITKQRLDSMDDTDLAVLGYSRFLACLENGIAAHHAGMVPPFKEVVEACFTEGLVKVVFATETLAVGINMPARTVVIEKLSKFTGEHHAFLTPGEYTQLTGRAGRRGIDTVGHAVVLWSPFVPFEQISSLASSKSFHLTSAFRPTYNMAANLVRAYKREQAEQLLSLSFAQYQADGDVVRIEARLARRRTALEEVKVDAVSPFGDVDEYRRLTSRKDRRDDGRAPVPAIEAALGRLRLGDIVMVEKGRHKGRVAVLSVTSRKHQASRVRAITSARVQVQLTAHDFIDIPKAAGRVEMPKPYNPNREGYQKEVARALDRAKVATAGASKVQDATQAHPVLNDPDLPARLKAASSADRLEREIDELVTRVGGRSRSLAKAFDRVMDVLTEWNYVQDWMLSPAGKQLSRLFHECDLLILEAMRRGLFDGLDGPSLACLMSVFTYEHRSSEPPPAPWFPTADVKKRWRSIERLADELIGSELRAGLNPTRRPDPTFAAIAYAWAAGEGFAEVVEAEELSGGDFVRNVKQLVDLLRQIAEIADHPATRRAAAQARDGLFRGVVAASSAVEVDGPEAPELEAS
jgi:ATP-dependent RNA helicase HelY